MPYVACPRCGIKTYSAARHSTHDCCPNCGTRLIRTPGVGAKEAVENRLSEILPNRSPASVRVAP